MCVPFLKNVLETIMASSSANPENRSLPIYMKFVSPLLWAADACMDKSCCGLCLVYDF